MRRYGWLVRARKLPIGITMELIQSSAAVGAEESGSLQVTLMYLNKGGWAGQSFFGKEQVTKVVGAEETRPFVRMKALPGRDATNWAVQRQKERATDWFQSIALSLADKPGVPAGIDEEHPSGAKEAAEKGPHLALVRKMI